MAVHSDGTAQMPAAEQHAALSSHAPLHQQQISSNCFRLVSLKREVQNDVEVVKPMLEELEVMRLGCALGMLSSVNPKDFAYDMLQAREFDEDFARFLRAELFGQRGLRDGSTSATTAASDSTIRVMSVFGKQAQVKDELTRWDCWSDACEQALHAQDQGIYCVHLERAGEDVLVLFAWLQDALFASEHLRDTPAYILRFLTSLSPDVTCTLSQEDVAAIERITTQLSMSQFDAWKSYSVAFRVEKQQDEKDEVRIRQVTKVDISTRVRSGGDRFLVKGSYLGLAVVRPSPAKTLSKPSSDVFHSVEALSKRMMKQAATHKLHVELKDPLSSEDRDSLLGATGRMPLEHLRAITEASEQKHRDVAESHKREADQTAKQFCDELLRISETIFSVDVMAKQDNSKDALGVFKECVSAMKNEGAIWDQIDESAKIVLNLPVRLMNQMSAIYEFFNTHAPDELSKSLDTLVRTKGKTFGKEPEREPASKSWTSTLREAGSAIKRTVYDTLVSSQIDVDEIPIEFREAMMIPLAAMKQTWWTTVGEITDTYASSLASEWTARAALNFVFEFERDRNNALAGALDTLFRDWATNPDRELSSRLNARWRHDRFYCNITEEYLEPPTDQLEVVRIDAQTSSNADTSLQSMGVVSLPPGDKVVSAFTIQKQSLLLVSTTSDARTRVSRIQFQLPDRYLTPPLGKTFAIKTFGRSASDCDFDLAQRTIAITDASNTVTLYKFNETFGSMEMIRNFDIGVRTSLASPLVDLLVLDSAVFLRDATMACQSVNLRSQQTSRRTQLGRTNGSKSEWHSGMFALSDGLVLGSLFLQPDGASRTGDDDGSFSTEFVAISSEDHRAIPVTFDSEFKLMARKGVSAQCVGDTLIVLDPLLDCIHVLCVDATVRSDSFRIQHSKEHGGSEPESESRDKLHDHWLWTFYHVYEKFPVHGMIYGHTASSILEKALRVKLVCPASTPAAFEGMCRQYFQSIMQNLHKLNKPLGVMDLSRDLVLVVSDRETSLVRPDEHNVVRAQSIRSFLQDLITFIPVQICRAENNTLTVMCDGQAKSESTTSHSGSKAMQTFEIAQSIRFGLLSPILESWRGRCVVITSMGKQSTGKSYFLNHLTGSSFAISGARCTDGAWMTVRVLPNDVLLVVLDFEGLGSFERTEQEDVFLSVLNAAISMFTVFRMEMRFDKEIDDIFSKFQKGVQLIKQDPKLFRGKLYMSVKDVNPNDQRGVLDEFVVKFQKLLGENKEHNFLSDLYSGQLDINCSPPLGTNGYYHSLMHAQQFIEHQLCSNTDKGFATGKQFLDCIRLLLAKIAILDWTSLDESAQKMHLSEIRQRLPGVVRTGCLVPPEHVADKGAIDAYLKEDLDDVTREQQQAPSNVCLETLLAEFPHWAEKWLELDATQRLDDLCDKDIDLGFDVCTFDDASIERVGASLLELFAVFLRFMGVQRNAKLVHKSYTRFDAFLAFVVARRKRRILAWATSVLGDRLPEEWKDVEAQYVTRFQVMYRRCPQMCSACQLGCMQSVVHTGEHDCGLGHVCNGRCEYCDASELPGKTPSCAKQAGHEGMCECADSSHTCGEACCLSSAPNCGKRCSQKTGHAGVHQCAVQTHRCGAPCCAKDCLGRCILSIEPAHTAHKCEEVRCVEKCLMDGCQELCGVMDHFHGQTDVQVAYSLENPSEKSPDVFDAASAVPAVHMCAKAHACPASCSEKGNCYVEVFHKESTKTFAGARGSFQYKYQEMNGFRKKCAQVLLPGQQTHHGRHTCVHEAADGDEESKSDGGSRTLHYCEYRCPCCSYFCRKEDGHFGNHATSHGNMRNTFFLADTDDIDLDDRKYKTGELGIAEMCNLYCSKMGRGHVHYAECEQQSADKCVHVGDSKDQRRHCTRELVPRPIKGIDEVLHEQFWKTLGWEDPCTSATERAAFAKCSYKCDAPEHDDQPSHCVLPAWHKPERKPEDKRVRESASDKYTYIAGHKFACVHAAQSPDVHHVFVLDCSGSMVGEPWLQLMAAWQGYLHNRVAQGALRDLVSVVTFNEEAMIEYEAQSIAAMLNASVQYRGGRTGYRAALQAANEVVSRMDFASFQPVVVFFSDGYPCDRDFSNIASHFARCYTMYELRVFAVGFGQAHLDMLQYVAELMGGEYREAVSGTELQATFHSISASLGSRVGLALTKPSHECMCPICQRDLASEEFGQMQPCLHEIHTACWHELVAQTSASGKTTTSCPMCRKDVSLK